MKHCKPILLASVLITLGGVSFAFGQGTNSFTYQGQLTDNGTAAQGSYDLRFRLYDDAAAGSQLGDVTVAPVAVSNGLFTVTLDFGADVFTGLPRWLGIGVRTNGSVDAHTLVTPRQPLTAAPYAIYAQKAASLPWSGLTGLPLGFADGVDNDTLYAAGAGLTLAGTNLALNTAFTDSRYWKLTGNAGTTAGVNFLGTTDNQALELKVNNSRALRLEPNATSPNVVGGYSGNVVDGGVYGATIGGGGKADAINRISAHGGTIGGGRVNTIATNAYYSSIGGGEVNVVEAEGATIGGGSVNDIGRESVYSTIGGGYINTIELGAFASTIGGGAYNTIATNAYYSSIGGGGWNTIATNAYHSTIGGGVTNMIQTNAYSSTIGGGNNNNIGANSAYSTIGGGRDNAAGTNSSYSAIGGGAYNNIAANSLSATIAGGYLNDVGTNSDYSAIGGGYNNNIAADSLSATIAGGTVNEIGMNSARSAIGGGYNNNIAANSGYATIAGGYNNDIGTNSDYSAIGGGYYNTVQTNALYATIPGGRQAKAAAYGQFAYASGQFAARGDAQASMFVLRRTASGATPTELFLDGSSAQITVPTNSTWAFDILVVGRSTEDQEFGVTSAAYQVRGLVVHDNVGTRVFALTPTVLHEDYGPWDVSVGTDGAGNHLVIKVVSTDFTVRWVANVRTAEVTFP